jgi:predicted lipoprotein
MKIKWLKYLVLIVVAGLLAYNSVYFKKLDGKKATLQTNLDPAQFARSFWKDKFTSYLDSAVDINSFIKKLKDDPNATFTQYAKTQGIGNTSCFLLKGEGQIVEVKDDQIVVKINSEASELKVKLNTGLYFGNAVRDVTGLIKMGDFGNTIDYNSVSSELNKIVQAEVISPLKIKAKKGHAISFIGCAEINKEQINITEVELLPVQIKM